MNWNETRDESREWDTVTKNLETGFSDAQRLIEDLRSLLEDSRDRIKELEEDNESLARELNEYKKDE